MLGFLKRLRPTLRPYEQRLIDALAGQLGPEAKALLVKQVEQVNLVQRHAEDKEVNLYAMKVGKPAFDGASLFPLRAEAKLAAITFKAPSHAKSCRVTFWLVNGHLFTLEFNQSPKALQPETIEIQKADVFVDPLKAVDAVQSGSAPLDAALPADYTDFVAQTEGSIDGDWRILRPSDIRSVVTADENYYVLAECPGRGVLAIKQASSDREIYFLGYDDDRVSLGTSLKRAVERMVTIH